MGGNGGGAAAIVADNARVRGCTSKEICPGHDGRQATCQRQQGCGRGGLVGINRDRLAARHVGKHVPWRKIGKLGLLALIFSVHCNC